MKRMCFATGLFAAMTCAGLNAQAMDLQANVPFDFQVGGKSMPAGEYLIRQSNGVLFLRGLTAGVFSITLPASRASAPATGTLDFTRYGDTYFLKKVWVPDSRDGWAVPMTKREKELASSGPVHGATIMAQRK